jgi:hypothetical protein
VTAVAGRPIVKAEFLLMQATKRESSGAEASADV